MLKVGASTGCKPGAADATVADCISGKESRDAPAPGATSPCRSVVQMHRVQMHPVLVLFELTHSLAKPINPRDVISNICVQLIYVDFNRRAINGL